MQQALWQSWQQAQLQGADPTASSSAGGTATQAKSIEEEVEEELEKGQGFQEEASSLEKLMCQRCLTSTEVDRLRTLTQMINASKQRVVELCEARVRENQAKQARTSAMLASLRPLQSTKPKSADKPAVPKADVAKAMPPPPVIVKELPRGGMKAPPPVLKPPLPPPVKLPPTQQPPESEQDSGQGPPPRDIPSTRFTEGSATAPASPKGRSTDQGQRPLISPKARPPPTIVIPSQKSNQPGANTAAMSSPRSVGTEDTAYLEDKLERRREAKRQWARTQEGTKPDEEDSSKYQRKSHHQEEVHHSSRDTRRRKRSKRDRSSSTESSGEDHRSTSTRESRSRRYERSRRHRSRSRGDSRSRRRRRSDSSDEGRRSRSDKRKEAHRSSKDRRRRDDSLSSSQQGEDRSKDGPSQQPQSQASQGQSKAQPLRPQPAANTAPTAQATTAPAAQPAVAQPVQHAPSLMAGQAQVQVARQAQAQLLAAHAIDSAATNIPIAKAMPIQQQPQAQTLAQPLPRPVFPPSSTVIQVPARPQAQQLSTPPGLGTELERTQATQIQQMQQQMAQLEAQLRAMQPTATQRQSSHSPSGNWGWSDQSHQSQWHGHGWQDWGNGRGYQ